MKCRLCMAASSALLSLLQLAAALCYFPNKDVADATACNSKANFSPCCGAPWVCLSNGLCQTTNSSGGFLYARGGCTDITWNSASCPQFCTAESPAGAPFMSDCGGGSWCCNAQKACCSDPKNLYQLGEGRIMTSIGRTPNFSYPSGQGTTSPATQSMAKPSTSSKTATASRATKSMVRPVTSSFTTATLDMSTQRTVTSTQTANTTSSNKDNISVKVGVGAGVPLGIAAFAALVYIVYLHHRKSRGKASEPTRTTGAEEGNGFFSTRISQALANVFQTVGYQPSELPAQGERMELFDTERHRPQENRVE